MPVMRVGATRHFRPKGFHRAAVSAEVLGVAVAVVGSDEEVRRSMSGAGSLLYPRHTDAASYLLLHTEADFPQALAVPKVAQLGHHHSHPQLLLPKADQMEDDSGIPSNNNLFRMSPRDSQTGMFATRAVLMWEMDTPACLALRTCARLHMIFTSPAKMRSSILI